MAKNLISDLILGAWGPNSGRQFFFFFFFFQKSGSSVTRCHSQQLSYTIITEKSNDPIFKKFSDGRGQTDESDFIGRFPTNVKRPMRTLRVINSSILRIKNTEFSGYLHQYTFNQRYLKFHRYSILR